MPGAIPGLTDVGTVSPLPPNPAGNQTFPSLTPAQSAANAKAAGASTTTSTNGSSSNVLGKTAFLQLLVQEMTNQDPLQPADDTQFIAQLAQFSSLEQMQNMNQTLTSIVSNDQIGQATAMLGHDVTAVSSSSGSQVNGWVDKVLVSNSTDPSSGAPTQLVQVDVSGTPVNVTDILSVGGLDQAATGLVPAPGSTGSASPTGSGTTGTSSTGSTSTNGSGA